MLPGIDDRPDQIIERYDVLASPPPRDLQALVDLAAQVCEVPTAAINLITDTEQHQVAAYGFDPSVCTREDSMCAAVLREPDPVVVSDASLDQRFASNPFVTGVIGSVRFYASAPLLTPGGVSVGRLCVFDDQPRELTAQQEAALVTLAARIVDILELRFRSRLLEESLLELTRTRDELKRSNEHLSRFAEQVSHDLRTPLTAILMSAELMATEPAVERDELLPDLLGNVIASARRMNQMIEQVLTFAREGGNIRGRAVPMTEVFERAHADLAQLAASSNTDIDVGELPTVHGDADMLYAVALNLMTNAIKFARPDVRPVVRVTGELVGDRAHVRVRDNGVGIPSELREEVFVLFARADDDVPGNGIGLATARRIVEAHGGRIAIEPSPPPGTTVVVELPGA